MSKKKAKRRGRTSTQQRPTSSLIIPIVVGVVVVALIVGAIISIEGGQNASAGPSGEGSAQGNTAQALPTQSLPYPDVPRVSLQETQEKLAQGQAILVDVRSRASYDESHAAGAVSMPEEEIGARLEELPKDKAIILYCT
jgi:hypothetical protein